MSRRAQKKTASAATGTTRRSKGSVPGNGSNHRWMIPGVCLFLAAIIGIAFGQTLQQQFVNFDDGDYVFKNARVAQGLTINGIVWAFTHVHSANWHPLTWISHMLDCQFYGLNPRGHHLTNVLLHAVVAILLFLALLQMTGSFWRSAFVGAVFAIHPLRVESVAWVAERKDLLSGLFFMLTLGAYLRYARGPWSPLRYGLVILSLALGLMCKPMLVTVPFLLLLLDFWPLNRFTEILRIPRRLILEKLPLLALAVASCAITLVAQRESMQPVAKISMPLRLGNAVISYVDYIRQMIWPSDLAVLYPWESARITLPAIVLSAALLLCVSAVVLVFRRHRYLVTGWFWYLLMLGPVIGILQVGNQARADRYTYLPQIGLYILVTWGVADLCVRWRRRHVLLTSVAGIILAFLLFSTRAQTAYWQDSESLWSRALACTTDNTIAEENLGEAYHAKGRRLEAKARFEKALLLAPNQAMAHSALGLVLLELGQADESILHLMKALEINPQFADAHYNLGNTLMEVGRPSEALIHYKTALEINPDDLEALNNAAWILATWPEPTVRDSTKAVELAERANELSRSENPTVCATLAAAYAEAGRSADAVKAAERALLLANAQGNTARADSIRVQLASYQSGAAFRDRRSIREK